MVNETQSRRTSDRDRGLTQPMPHSSPCLDIALPWHRPRRSAQVPVPAIMQGSR